MSNNNNFIFDDSQYTIKNAQDKFDIGNIKDNSTTTTENKINTKGIDLYNLNLINSNDIKSVLVSCVNTLCNKLIYNIASQAFDNTFDELYNNPSINLSLLNGIAEQRDIDYINYFCNGQLDYSVYKNAIKNNDDNIIRVYQQYCLSAPFIEAKYTTAPLLLPKHYKDKYDNFMGGNDSLIYKSTNMLISSLTNNTDIYTTETEQLIKNIGSIVKDNDINSIDSDKIYPIGDTILLNKSITNNSLIAIESNKRTASSILPDDSSIKASIINLVDLIGANNILGTIDNNIHMAINILNQLKGLLILINSGDILNILQYLGQYNTQLNNIISTVYSFNINQQIDTIFNNVIPIHNLLDSIDNMMNDNKILSAMSPLINNVISKLTDKYTDFYLQQKKKLLDALHISQLLTDNGLKMNNKIGSIGELNSIIKVIDETINILNTISEYTDVGNIYNYINNKIINKGFNEVYKKHFAVLFNEKNDIYNEGQQIIAKVIA